MEGQETNVKNENCGVWVLFRCLRGISANRCLLGCLNWSIFMASFGKAYASLFGQLVRACRRFLSCCGNCDNPSFGLGLSSFTLESSVSLVSKQM